MILYMVKTYLLPMVGTVLNWETFSGSAKDPIRSLGVWEFLRDNEHLQEVMRVTRVKRYNIDEGLVDVEVIAGEQFHVEFTEWLEGKSPQDICKIYGKEQLIFPLDGIRPDEQLLKVGHL